MQDNIIYTCVLFLRLCANYLLLEAAQRRPAMKEQISPSWTISERNTYSDNNIAAYKNDLNQFYRFLASEERAASSWDTITGEQAMHMSAI